MKDSNLKLLHIARIVPSDHQGNTLYLRKVKDHQYSWFREDVHNQEIETGVAAPSVEEAIKLGYRHWKKDSFRLLHCGFRYTLPERDEHGVNALFHQMVASYSNPTGVYFDEDLENNCIVRFASIEAQEEWKKLKTKDRL